MHLITAFKVEVKVSQDYANENGGDTVGDGVGDNVAKTTREDAQKSSQISVKAVEKHLKNLRDQGIICRVGHDKGGHWEIVAPGEHS